jgi:hypothetical protein
MTETDSEDVMTMLLALKIEEESMSQCRGSPEAGKGKEMDYFLEPPEGISPVEILTSA